MQNSKKIEQDFILSNSSLNVYGFRLLTTGCLIDEVIKNPIGYYNHDTEGGVLVRWNDVRIEGDNILGKPVINLSHPRGARTVQEIEDGFLNAASVGKIVLLSHVLEDNEEDTDPVLTGTSWYYKECSLVDSPANRAAFKVELYDINDTELSLADLTTIQLNTKPANMKEITLKMTPQLIGLLGLGDTPDSREVSKAIKELHSRAARGEEALTKVQDMEQQLQDLKDTATKADVAALLKRGLADRKLTVALRDQLATDYATNPTGLKALIDALPVYKSVAEQINASSPTIANLADKTWDELDRTGRLQELKETDMDLYKAKFKTKFKKEYKG